MRTKNQYDVFISHAHEDKEDFVRPLAKSLIAQGVSVWFDELSIKIGDSLRSNIDRGLNDSTYGVVVLSPSFLSKEWPERELNGLVSKAIYEGRKVLLPIWHNVTYKTVAEYSLPLADLYAANSANGLDQVVKEIMRVVQDDSVMPDGRVHPPQTLAALANHNTIPTQSKGDTSHMPSYKATTPIHEKRAQYSRKRLDDFTSELQDLTELKNFPNLAIFAAGSFARLEASEYSDIDLFFIAADDRQDIEDPHTKELRLLGKIIEIGDKLHFPKFSNDCQYLVISHSGEIIRHLGGPSDDYRNFFTTRMLLLLEGHCLYGKEVYDNIQKSFIEPYFVDYPDHRQTFQPVFLLNDIHRYWKTILLNYEHKRGEFSTIKGDDEKRTKQKVRNFKLKFSRMSTCFATVGAIGSHTAPVNVEQVLKITAMTPRERILSIPKFIPETQTAVDEVLSRYTWFLEMTGQTIPELEEHFSDKQKRTEMFQLANEFGDAMYNLIQAIDLKNDKSKLLRYLVI